MAYSGYLRKSRKDLEAEQQGMGETLARHRKALLQCALRNGHVIDQFYEEIVTGDSISAREQMQLLLADVQAGKWQGVYVYEVERLARGDTIDQGVVALTFQYSGTLIYTPMRTYDPSSESDNEYFEFGLFMSRREYNTTRRRLMDGRTTSHYEGKYMGSRRPYGYNRYKLPKEKGWSLEVIPEEAAIVRLAADAYLNGMKLPDPVTGEIVHKQAGAQIIADYLNSIGQRTSLGRPWTAGQVRYMLRQPIYIGKVQWYQKETKIKIVNGQRTKYRCKSDKHSIVDGRHEPILDMETWLALQAKFRSHVSPVNDKKLMQSPLNGIVKCGICGMAMVRTPMYGAMAGIDYLKCSTSKCQTSAAPLADVEELILSSLREWVDWADHDAWPADMRNPTNDLVADVRAATQRQLDDLQKRRLRLMDLLEKDVYDIPTYNARKAVLDADLARITAALQELPPPTKDRRTCIQALIPQVRTVLQTYSTELPAEVRNQLLRSVVDKIIYHKTHRCRRNERSIDFVELEIYPKIL